MQVEQHKLTETGKGLDLGFLGKPHEHDPRRIYSTAGTDWQARVDFDRLRRDGPVIFTEHPFAEEALS